MNKQLTSRLLSFFISFIFIIFSVQLVNAQAIAPAGYSACSGIDPSYCDLTTYDPNRCDPYAGSNDERLTWNRASCVSQLQGCFIKHPDLSNDVAGAERGVCILPREVQDYSCSNRPPDGSCGSEYNLCFNEPLDAGVGNLSDCGCVESTINSNGELVNLCMYLNQDQLDQIVNSTNFTDSHCPTCPAGYTASSVDGKCWPINGGDVGDRVDVLSFISCSDQQICSYNLDGAGCEDILGGGCISKMTGDTCGGDRAFNCTSPDGDLCCETLGQCVGAGGETEQCVPTGDLTPASGPTSCLALFPEDFPQLCQKDSWSGITLNQSKYCCYSQDACDDIGGFDIGVVNDRPVGDYDICLSNLGTKGTNQDGGAGALDLCNECFSKKGIWTAIGCIDQKPKTMVSKLMTIGVGTLGGVFLLRVLAAAFILTTSQGDVKKTSEGKQMITEAVVGVLFILFSVTILQFIGADVLKIPGFGS